MAKIGILGTGWTCRRVPEIHRAVPSARARCTSDAPCARRSTTATAARSRPRQRSRTAWCSSACSTRRGGRRAAEGGGGV